MNAPRRAARNTAAKTAGSASRNTVTKLEVQGGLVKEVKNAVAMRGSKPTSYSRIKGAVSG